MIRKTSDIPIPDTRTSDIYQDLYHFYYRRAYRAAASDDLSSAIRHAAVAAASNPEDKDARMLLCLIHYRLGDFAAARGALAGSGIERTDITDTLDSCEGTQEKINRLIDSGDTAAAIRLLCGIEDKSVRQYNMLGCLYMLRNKPAKARAVFLAALALDRKNEDALRFLSDACKTTRKEWWKVWK